MRTLLLFAFCIAIGTVQAQKKKKQDIDAIKAMCGCYEVSFNFAETFSPNKDYKFHDNYRSGGLEYVFPIEESKDKIVLQHLLIVGDNMIIKHWRQDWIYENTDFHTFYKDNTWKYESKSADEVQGQWTQKVYQVDDGPRYEGSSSWVHVDGRSYWENTADAPLPRREFSKRNDYNVMVRRNRQEITADGWVHEQDNAKVLRETDDTVLAHEKGFNEYKKTDAGKCQAAKDWWNDKQAYWNDVRTVWNELFAQKKTVQIEGKIDDKVLFMKLFALEEETLKDGYNSAESITKIKETINSFLKGDIALASN